MQDLKGNGRFTTESQGHIQISDDDQRTGTFLQMRVTMGDTACNVDGV